MTFLPLIEAKRDGTALSPGKIAEIVQAFTAGEIPDYQMAAFLMAVLLRGMSPTETRALTLAMRDSGETLKLPEDPRPVVDKHSTGGVGDKVSLPLAPLLACLGFLVPMISGRGLGITGGTLDKLESIPGYRTQLTREEIIQQVQTVGCVICGQTEKMVPADRAMYALRDVTGTVPSIPLITASILSKKLAEDLQALILDVKFGSAAFMQTLDQARELALSMAAIAKECGVKFHALLTNMDRPLGRTAGNWLEVRESVECLENRGPEDLRILVIECAAHVLVQTARTTDLTEARQTASACLASGQPRQKWDAMLQAQGTDLRRFQDKLKQNSTAAVVVECHANESGFIASCNARAIGELVRDLGGGRLTKTSTINPDVGVDQLAQCGQQVAKGGLLGRVHAASREAGGMGLERLRNAFTLSSAPIEVPPLIQEVIL